MDAEIGLAAGDVYRFLEEHGPSTLNQLKKGTGHKDALLSLAIGWLAREGKVLRETDGRNVRWGLAQG